MARLFSAVSSSIPFLEKRKVGLFNYKLCVLKTAEILKACPAQCPLPQGLCVPCLPLDTCPSRGTEAPFSVQGVLGRAQRQPPPRPHAVSVSVSRDARAEVCTATWSVAVNAQGQGQGQGQGQPARVPVRAQALSCEQPLLATCTGTSGAVGATSRPQIGHAGAEEGLAAAQMWGSEAQTGGRE